jgi:cell division protein FtsL
MDPERPRWRIRISTLMFLVVIAALGAALFVEHTKRLAAEQRAAEQLQRAEEVGRAALAVADQARAQAERVEARHRKELEEAKNSGRRGEVKAKGE